MLWTALALSTGCGRQAITLHEVTGEVRFANGDPVGFGQVEVYDETHELTSTGPIQKDGTFALGTYKAGDGAPEGVHRAIVVQLILPSDTGVSPHHHGDHVATKYADFATSQLEVKVERGANQVEIVVEPARSPAKQR